MPLTLLASLKRGVVSGAVGGLFAGAFGFLLAEPVMDRAVDLESGRQAAAGEHTVEVFSRHTQHLGFLGATFAVGLALGVLYGVVHHLLSRGRTSEPWAQALRLGAGAFFGLTLVPFLRYPANPPGVGDSATIATRSHLWTVTLVIGLVGACVAGLVAGGLRDRGVRPPLRQLSVAAVLVATIALTFVLPDSTDEVLAPASLIWQFRLLSLATLALLWGGLSVTFGLLGEREASAVPADPRELAHS